MKIYSFILLICISIFFSSCYRKRDAMHHFSPQDSLYFNVYDTQKYYTFCTNTGIDTILFKKKYVEENYKEWYFDMSDGPIFEAYFCCEGIFIHNSVEETFHYSYKKCCDNQDPELTVIWGELYAMPVNDLRNFSEEGIYKDTIIVDKKNYRPGYYFKNDKCSLVYLKWHKYKGVIEYKLSDGTIYKDETKNCI